MPRSVPLSPTVLGSDPSRILLLHAATLPSAQRPPTKAAIRNAPAAQKLPHCTEAQSPFGSLPLVAVVGLTLSPAPPSLRRLRSISDHVAPVPADRPFQTLLQRCPNNP